MKSYSSPRKYVSVYLLLLTIVCALGDNVHGQEGTTGSIQRRSAQLRRLINTLEGSSRERPEIFRTTDGYVRNLLAPPSTRFPVEANARGTPETAARSFLHSYETLFAAASPRLGFDVLSVKTDARRSFVRYQQKYAELEVFGALVIVQVNTDGGIEAVTSDIMRDPTPLDAGTISLSPSMNASTAQEKAEEFLAAEYEQLRFEAGPSMLKVFSPGVVGLTGPTCLVWQTEVSSEGDDLVKELVLVDANSGTIILHYSLFRSAKYRRIHDWEGTTTNITYNVRVEEDVDPCGITDVDNAFDYLEDTYDFYMTHHGRDSYNGSGADLVAQVRYGISWAKWHGTYMRIAEDEVTDDTVGHEFTHGVIGSNLVGYGDAGAIEESLCDSWGEWIDQSNADGNDAPGVKWHLFEDWASGDPYPWRRMDDPYQICTSITYGSDFNNVPQPDRYDSDYYYRSGSPYFPNSNFDQDDGGVHHNVGVGNRLCFLLTDGGSHNGHSWSGFDISRTADLYYECIDKQLLPSSCDYYDLYFALVQAATNLSFNSTDRENIRKACEAVGICPPGELEAHWKLDETSGTTASDSVGSNDGSVSGATWTAGKLGNALSFDAPDANVALSSIEALQGKSASIAAWIKPGSTSGTRPIVTQYQYSGGYQGHYLCLEGAQPAFYLNDEGGACGTSITGGEWSHLVGTHDRVKLRIYVNGASSGDFNAVDEGGINHDAYIGYSGTGYYFNGLIDDVRVYNYALSDDEIDGLWSYGKPRVLSLVDASGALVALINNEGDLFLNGSLTENTTPQASGSSEFRVQNSNEQDVAIIDTSTGNMVIAGSKYEEQADLSGASNFVVKDAQANVVAYIDTSGNLYLKGKIYSNWQL